MSAPASVTPEPAARRSLRARLAGGPLARAIGRGDLVVFRVLRTRWHGDRAERAVAQWSATGEHGALWFGLGAVGAALDAPRRAAWGRGVAAIAVTYVANTGVKAVARRSRPALEDLPQLIRTPTQLSFPSAHAALSFAAARSYRSLLPAAPLYVAATGMAVSRVYLGVHYPSDIVAGALLGTVVGGLAR